MTPPTFTPPPELGLGTATLQPLEHLAAPPSAAGLGLAGAPTLSEVVSTLLTAPHTAEPITPRSPRAAALSATLGDLRWWARHPGIFVVDSELEATLHGGRSQRLPEGELIVDARAELTWLRLRGHDVDAVWQLNAQGATLHLVHPQAPATPPAFALPALETLTGGEPIAPWLLQKVEALAAADTALSRVAAIGMLGRLWSHPAPGRLSVAALLELTLPGPSGRAWAQALPQEVHETVLAEAITAVSTLFEALSGLEAAILGRAAGARDQAHAWIEERDRLESVRFVLGGQDAPEALNRALLGLDRHAAVHHSLWSLLPGWEEDPHLVEVAARDPEAWWGRLSGL